MAKGSEHGGDDDIIYLANESVDNELSVLKSIDPGLLNVGDNAKILTQTNNLDDIMTGFYNCVKRRIHNQKVKQVGESFGNHDILKESDEYEKYK